MPDVAVPLKRLGLVPIQALRALWRLEEMGAEPRVVAGRFVIRSEVEATLSERQRAVIAEQRTWLKRLVQYVEGQQ